MIDFSVISDSDEGISTFVFQCDNMASSKFILAEKNIREILKTIAGSRKLLSLFAYAAAGYNFNHSFDKYIVVKDKEKFINIPNQAKEFIAFTYSLLMEIDMKNIDMHKLLNEYYSHPEGPVDSYKLFIKNLIIPFKNFVQDMYVNVDIQQIILQ